MKKLTKPIIAGIFLLVLILSIILTASLAKGEDTSKYKDEISSLESKLDRTESTLDAKEKRLDRCILVMNKSILANAYFIVGFTDTANIAEYYSLASDAMDEYDSTDTDYCRGD